MMTRVLPQKVEEKREKRGGISRYPVVEIKNRAVGRHVRMYHVRRLENRSTGFLSV